MTIRKAGPEDLEKILELYQHLFTEEEYSQRQDFEAKWKEIQDLPGLVYFLGEVDGKAVATAHIMILPNLSRGRRSYALIENVVVHAAHRRRGSGRLLMEQILGYARQADCYKVMLLSTASHDREAAHAFYQSLGFDGDSKRGFVLKF